ncbi:hypothetical protein DYBT9275_03473 [Dyadobacter sp. CECT 9275]|uniref:Uncharacterized protein n=1 Tax=Dyadobacter helix TaxID=2822344 RepID=A0A916N5F4_9BACT|nr:hypothetical protein DYBT9275_03473 [Dyadobacter sp. CECT 9275]
MKSPPQQRVFSVYDGGSANRQTFGLPRIYFGSIDPTAVTAEFLDIASETNISGIKIA